jgi:CheY-like chemotaxis protein
VLVVEDNEVNQLVAVGMLEVLGYTSEVAADGAAAAARAAGSHFDAVLMDLQMPRLDGYAATRLIRQAEPPGVRLPIIALTASATAGEQERCLAAGMTGFLSKPVTVEALGRVLHEQLAGGTAGETAGQTADDPIGDAPGDTVDAPAGPVIPDAQEISFQGLRLREIGSRTSGPEGTRPTPTLDTSRLAELAEMGAAALPLVQRAIDNFVGSAGDRLRDLRDALASGEVAALRSAAHQLKGSAANLGALRVAELAFQVESRADSGEIDGVGDVLAELASALTEAGALLRDYELAADPVDQAFSA